ncbi:MAG: FkbM family methyltransferase [Salibacteraceae bacterium]
MKKTLIKFLQQQGIMVKRYSPQNSDEALLAFQLNRLNIDLVLDIGGNSGQFATHLRKMGYRGKIISCEPLSKVFAQLKANAQADPLWEVHHVAIGREPGESTINISENTYSSSLLGMHTTHQSAAETSRYIDQETIKVVPLREVLPPELRQKHRSVFLKVDVQGFEREVIEGALQELPDITLVELELSMVPLYENGPLYQELINRMDELNFSLFNMASEFRDPKDYRILQMNGLFLNRSKDPSAP